MFFKTLFKINFEKVNIFYLKFKNFRKCFQIYKLYTHFCIRIPIFYIRFSILKIKNTKFIQTYAK